jgi:hypothetical protein
MNAFLQTVFLTAVICGSVALCSCTTEQAQRYQARRAAIQSWWDQNITPGVVAAGDATGRFAEGYAQTYESSQADQQAVRTQQQLNRMENWMRAESNYQNFGVPNYTIP